MKIELSSLIVNEIERVGINYQEVLKAFEIECENDTTLEEILQKIADEDKYYNIKVTELYGGEDDMLHIGYVIELEDRVIANFLRNISTLYAEMVPYTKLLKVFIDGFSNVYENSVENISSTLNTLMLSKQ